jgi:hypothetical protein
MKLPPRRFAALLVVSAAMAAACGPGPTPTPTGSPSATAAPGTAAIPGPPFEPRANTSPAPSAAEVAAMKDIVPAGAPTATLGDTTFAAATPAADQVQAKGFEGVASYGHGAGWRGIDLKYAYTNNGGVHPDKNCGQAAAATLLTYYNVYPKPAVNDAYRVRALEYAYPQDVAFGLLGSSWQLMQKMVSREGLRNVGFSYGETAMKNAVAAGHPVIVMMDVGAAGWNAWGLHWTVVYAYDNNFVYLTNWKFDKWGASAGQDVEPWSWFRAGRDTYLTRGGGFANWNLVAYN